MMIVEGPNGIKVEFPDGTDPDTINKVMMQAYEKAMGTPQKSSSSAGQIGAGLVEGVAGLAGIPGSLESINNLWGSVDPAEAKAFASRMGQDLSAYDYFSGVAQGMKAPTPQDMIGAVESVTGKFPAYEDGNTAQQYMRTGAQFAPGALLGPGSAMAKGLGWAASALGSETAGQATEGTWAEPYARFAGAVVPGMAGYGVGDALSKPRAPIGNVSSGAQARVGNALNESFPNEQAALSRAAELGDEAMLLNLGRRPAQQASTIAAYPGEGAATIGRAVNEQLSRSGVRAADDWQQAIGPSLSRQEKQLQTAATKAGTSNIYEIAKGRTVDPSSVQAQIIRELTEAGNDPQARTLIKEVSDLLTDPRTGRITINPRTGQRSVSPGTRAFISDAGGLVVARQRISDMITKLGKEVSNNPGDDLFKVGSRTSIGSRLAKIRKSINDVLHQDTTLKDADKIWSGAERSKTAFETGRTKLLGTGDSVMEPEALAAKLPGMSVEERAALLQGLSRKGNSILRDVRPNRNDGKAMGDAIATENNLDRISLAAGRPASDRVRNMAAREDLFAKDASRVTGNSATAERLLGSNEFPSPIMGNKDYASVGQRSLTGTTMELVARLMDKATGGVVSAKRAKMANDAAKLLVSTGGNRDEVVRKLMSYSKSLPTSDPLKDLITRSLVVSNSATVPSRVGN